MRLQIIRSKNAASLYVVKSVFINGKRTSKVVERLGTYSSLERSLNGKDPIVWAKEHDELQRTGTDPVPLLYDAERASV